MCLSDPESQDTLFKPILIIVALLLMFLAGIQIGIYHGRKLEKQKWYEYSQSQVDKFYKTKPIPRNTYKIPLPIKAH